MLRGVPVADLPSLTPEQVISAKLGDGKWRPFYVRLSFLLLPDAFSPVVVKVFTFGCLSLFVIVDAHGLPRGHFQKFVCALTLLWPNSIELRRRSDRAVLKECPRTWMDEYLPMLKIE